ncbi:MAG: hypothetical protein ABIJ40_06630 [Bacteroidota bacterium]
MTTEQRLDLAKSRMIELKNMIKADEYTLPLIRDELVRRNREGYICGLKRAYQIIQYGGIQL